MTTQTNSSQSYNSAPTQGLVPSASFLATMAGSIPAPAPATSVVSKDMSYSQAAASSGTFAQAGNSSRANSKSKGGLSRRTNSKVSN